MQLTGQLYLVFVGDFRPIVPFAFYMQGYIAFNLDKQGKHQQAEKLLEEIWQQQIENFGPDHDATLFAMSNVAHNRVNLGRLKDGENLYRRFLEIVERRRGSEHPDVLLVKTNLINV